ncbi:MAG TPA: hypothetical protein PK987_11455 [Ferruginibacter sp.]|nr:hypothetical protein [Ferruginibacter sp.]
MELNKIHRKQVAYFYVVCFLISYAWLFFNSLLLHQLKPVLFINRLDISLNILFLTGIQKAVIQNNFLQLLLDILYLFFPFTLLLTVNSKKQIYAAIGNSVFNFIYALLLSSFSTLSIEGFVSWILLPLLFLFNSEKGFYYVLHSMRYVFLMIFFSTGLWKLRAGGIFNIDEMSGILLKQHAAYISQQSNDWFSSVIHYLVVHYKFSYTFYLATTLLELTFVVGLFTRKFDKLLIVLFILFVCFDFVLMRINYFSWVAFLGCLWYAKYDEAGKDKPLVR